MITCNRGFLEQRCAERGYSLEQVMACVVAQDGDNWTIDETHDAYPKIRKASPKASYDGADVGPGTELKKLLARWLGFVSSVGCKCNAMAAKMNALGPDWCEGEGMAEILETMRNEHAKRRKAGQTVLPWVDVFARKMVAIACKRARAQQ
jgi:hypothetical protein